MLDLWQRVLICKEFPAYTLETARRAGARDVLRAMRLLAIARDVEASKVTAGG